MAIKLFIQHCWAETPSSFSETHCIHVALEKNCHETSDVIELGVEDVFQGLTFLVYALSVIIHNRSDSRRHHAG